MTARKSLKRKCRKVFHIVEQKMETHATVPAEFKANSNSSFKRNRKKKDPKEVREEDNIISKMFNGDNCECPSAADLPDQNFNDFESNCDEGHGAHGNSLVSGVTPVDLLDKIEYIGSNKAIMKCINWPLVLYNLIRYVFSLRNVQSMSLSKQAAKCSSSFVSSCNLNSVRYRNIFICLSITLIVLLDNSRVSGSRKACITNCSCTVVPSSNLASEKWAKLIPSASPTLLSSLFNSKPKYLAGSSVSTTRLPAVISEKVSPASVGPVSSPNQNNNEYVAASVERFPSESKRSATVAKHKRYANEAPAAAQKSPGVMNINENIIEIQDTSPHLSKNTSGDNNNNNAAANDSGDATGEDKKLRSDGSLTDPADYSSYIQTLKNDPYLRQLYLNWKLRQKNLETEGKPRAPLQAHSLSSQERQDEGASNVPRIIEEQIPDFHTNGFSSHANLHERFNGKFQMKLLLEMISLISQTQGSLSGKEPTKTWPKEK